MEKDTNGKATTDIRIPSMRQIGITLGDLGYYLVAYWMTAFISIFYTDVVGVNAAAVAGMLLIVRLFDGVDDPLIGAICDSVKVTTRWGRYRIWVAVGSVLSCICVVCLFSANPSWPQTVKIVYMYAMYIIATVATSMHNISYSAMISVSTTDSETRVRMAGKRQLFIHMGTGLLGMVAVLAISTFGAGNDRKGYFLSVLLTCVVGMLFMLNSARVSKEVVSPAVNNKVKFGTLMKCIVGNKNAVICVVAGLTIGLSFGRSAMYAYYFRYFVNDYSLFASYSLILMLGTLAGAALMSFISLKRAKNKGRLCAYVLASNALLSAAIFFFPAPSLTYFVLLFFNGITLAVASTFITSLPPDCVDYSEAKYGVRADGFMGACSSFFTKVGAAVGPATLMAAIGRAGYVANEPQNESVLAIINVSVSLIPAVLYLFTAILMLFYDLSNEKHQQIVDELDAKRNSGSQVESSL